MGILRINRQPSRLQLNLFGAGWLVVFGMIAAAGYGCGASTTAFLAAAIAAVSVPLIGWMVPPFMRAVYLGSVYAAWPIGFVVSHSVLAGVYYVVLTPTGLLLRRVGHDPLGRRFNRGVGSYWEPREGPPAAERYFRQF